MQVYAVTTRHVVDLGATVLRVNRIEGGVDTIVTDPTHWVMSDEHDLAIYPLDMAADHAWYAIATTHFATEQMTAPNGEFTVGSETFMVGRLANTENSERNTPVVRFGHVSMTQGPIRRSDGQSQNSFVVECRSASGFSGSPVFVISGSGRYAHLGERQFTQGGPDFERAYLLGIDWGHIPLWRGVFGPDRQTPLGGMRVDQNSGMAGVIPPEGRLPVRSKDASPQRNMAPVDSE